MYYEIFLTPKPWARPILRLIRLCTRWMYVRVRVTTGSTITSIGEGEYTCTSK